jgi:hypothetical protein
MQRLMWSRTPDKFEVEVVEDYIQQLIKQRRDFRAFYIYVNLDTEDGGIEIVNYPSKSIQVIAKTLECTDREALYCCATFPGFLSEIRDILYWNGINDLRKYIVITESYDDKEKIVLSESVTYARTIQEAKKEFTEMGFIVNSITDVDD